KDVDAVLEGEGEDSVASNIVGNKGTSYPENPLVDRFMLLNTFIVRDGTE
ncbi:hypothetical protein Tco_0402284, partial [Tanacetum coccineum]